jgi:hypothetical protein
MGEALKELVVDVVGVALFCYALFLACLWCVFC